MVSIGQGASQLVQDQFKNLGSNVIVVLPGSTQSGGVRQFTATTLSKADAYAIAEEVNATAYLKNDAAWRKQSLEVRAAALQVARESGDLTLAKKSLKEIYNRCEACHQKYQK